MDATTIMAQLEAAVANQVALAGADPLVESAAASIVAALAPALRHSVIDLAEQAAAEVRAQVVGHQVDVVLVDGEPTLRVSADAEDADIPDDDYEARITLRLPEALKSLIEDSANAAGDSVNSWMVKTVSSKVKVRRRPGGTRVTGTIET
jgi:hypothetical protein